MSVNTKQALLLFAITAQILIFRVLFSLLSGNLAEILILKC